MAKTFNKLDLFKICVILLIENNDMLVFLANLIAISTCELISGEIMNLVVVPQLAVRKFDWID